MSQQEFDPRSTSPLAWPELNDGPIVWPADSQVLEQGVIPRRVYILDDGAVKIAHVRPDGNERVLDVREAPALLGAAFVLADRPSSVDVFTITPCTLRSCSSQVFIATVEVDAVKANELLRWQASEVLTLWDRAVTMAAKDAAQRLDDFMEQHGRDSSGGQASSGRPFKQALIAACINVTPEHLSRLRKKMAKTEPRPHVKRRRSRLR